MFITKQNKKGMELYLQTLLPKYNSVTYTIESRMFASHHWLRVCIICLVLINIFKTQNPGPITDKKNYIPELIRSWLLNNINYCVFY